MNRSKNTEEIIEALKREPTVHFFIAAAFIFVVYAISDITNGDTIEVDQREIDARILMQEMAFGQPLTEDQRELIASSYVEEQILVKEAKDLELDNDARIHDMLAQKMRHVLSGNIIQPTSDELERFYKSNTEAYRTMPSVSVDELVLDTREEIPAQVQILLEQGSDSDSILALTQGTNAPLPNVNHLDLSNIFAPEFADAVFQSQNDEWVGPFASNRGQHFLKVIESSDERLPPLEEILDRVRLDWIAQEEEIRLQEEVNKLWNRYKIVVNNAKPEQH